MRERRRHPRYVVEGLDLFVDGLLVHVLDVSAVAVRLLAPGREPPRPCVSLRFESQGGRPPLRAQVVATLFRTTGLERVYLYDPPAADWDAQLAAFDTFRELHVAALEG